MSILHQIFVDLSNLPPWNFWAKIDFIFNTHKTSNFHLISILSILRRFSPSKIDSGRFIIKHRIYHQFYFEFLRNIDFCRFFAKYRIFTKFLFLSIPIGVYLQISILVDSSWNIEFLLNSRRKKIYYKFNFFRQGLIFVDLFHFKFLQNIEL